MRQWVLRGEYAVKADPLVSLQSMMNIAPLAARYVLNCHWRVLVTPDDTAFFTSDGPLVRVTTARLPAWSGVGWLTPWMEATLPLSPQACLLMSLHYAEGREFATPEQVREVNWRTAAHAHQEVYATRSLGFEELERPNGRAWTRISKALRPVNSSVDAPNAERSDPIA